MKLLEVLSDWIVFLVKLYNFVIYLVSILLIYFTTYCRSMAWIYLQKIQNQLEVKRSKGAVVVYANATSFHKLPLMLIRKYNKPACFSNQTCPLKYAAQKCAWMDIPAFWNWFNDVFYLEVRNFPPSSFAYGKWSRSF